MNAAAGAGNDGHGACFHCGERLPLQPLLARVGERSVEVCCAGCAAAAELISAMGLNGYYAHRAGFAPRPAIADTAAASGGQASDATWLAFDRPALAAELVEHLADGGRALTLPIEGVRCAACAWLIENALTALPGVRSAQVNPLSARLSLILDESEPALSQILTRIAALGYRPHPEAAGTADAGTHERHDLLKRLAVAGLASMQSMTYGFMLWFAPETRMDVATRLFFEWISLLLAIPVVVYAAAPFLRGASVQLLARRPGMDVPIALAVLVGFTASAWNTLQGQWPVYYDSVSMFVFLLLTGRYLELTARTHAGDVTGALASLLPATATRLEAGVPVHVGRSELRPGDAVLVRPGEPVPADAVLVSSAAELDESMLTGESRAVLRRTGDALTGGSLNAGSVFEARIERVGTAALISRIGRLVATAQAERPAVALAADRIALTFVLAVIVLAVGAGAWWWQSDPERAVPVALAILIATCPCALGLATPAAYTCATGALARIGVFVTRARALSALAAITDVAFDKTGTLTRGAIELTGVEVLRNDVTAESATALAAALEHDSEHALARAFPATDTAATDVVSVTGRGVEGSVAGYRLRIGEDTWVAGLAEAGSNQQISPATSTRARERSARVEQRPIGQEQQGVAAQPRSAQTDLAMDGQASAEAQRTRSAGAHSPRWRMGRAAQPRSGKQAPEPGVAVQPRNRQTGSGHGWPSEHGRAADALGGGPFARKANGAERHSREAVNKLRTGRAAQPQSGEQAPERGVAVQPRSGKQALNNQTNDGSQSHALLGDEKGVIARFTFRDQLKSDAADCVQSLRQLGINVVLLSGDSQGAVAHTARVLGIDDARSRLLPGDKVNALQALQASGRRVLMVGDGVNDAPVLAAATAAIAIGTGSAMSQAQADAVLAGPRLWPIVTAIRHARRTQTVVRQNLLWALFYNVSALPVAAAGLLEPWAAAVGMSASSLLVVANALRLRKLSPATEPSANAVCRAAPEAPAI